MYQFLIIVYLFALVNSRALSPIILPILHRCFVRTSTESAWPENHIKIPLASKELWPTLAYGFSIESTVKFDKSDLSIKNARVFKLHIKFSRLFVNFKEDLQYMFYRLKLHMSETNQS